MSLKPRFYGWLEPVHPCRVMDTRHCPAVYDSVCGDRPCARYESDDETPWIPEAADKPWFNPEVGLIPREDAP